MTTPLAGAPMSPIGGADYIAEHGLRQDGEFGSPGESCCAIGSVYSAQGVNANGRTVSEFEHVWDLLDAAVGMTAPWNDAPERTAAEVISKMREIADGLDAGAVAAVGGEQQ